MHVFLETERLILRRLTRDDVDDLVRLDSDPEVMAFIDRGPAPSRAEMVDRVDRFVEDYARFDGLGRYAAIAKSGGEFLGWMSLRADGSPGVDLGYRLVRFAWGYGYATEGSRALVAKAFRGYPVDRVFATTMAVNLRSRAVMERAGLRFVRVFHEDFADPIPGTEQGEVEYAITRAEWENARDEI